MNRNFRFTLLNVLLLLMVFLGIYLLTILARQLRPGYFVALAILLYTGTALNRARTVVTPPRFPIMREKPEELGLPSFEEVVFNSRDGIELDGWYFKASNRAAVIMVHSLGSSRMQMRHYARALIAKGYGVLMFDLRGHARSAGNVSSFGWYEQEDVFGALEFLRTKDEIDPQRIGLLGFSMGAQVAVRAAAASDHFQAVWADGLIPVVYEDHFVLEKRSFRTIFFSPWWWFAYRIQSWLLGYPEPAGLREVIAGLSPKSLMIVAAGDERMMQLGRAFYNAAGEPREFWQLDDIPFGTGVLEYGDDYDLKLVGFFNRTLLRS